MSASNKPEARERVRQKLRTRGALLAAAKELVGQGKAPTVAEVADAAGVSRATAYRYFPTQEMLLLEVPLDAAVPTVASLFGDSRAPTDPEDRAVLLQNAFYDFVREHEAEFRLFLRATLLRPLTTGASVPFRGARRTALLDAALAPLTEELPTEEIDQLKTALSTLIGLEPVLVFRDILGLTHEEARAAGEQAVRLLVRAARRRLGEAGG